MIFSPKRKEMEKMEGLKTVEHPKIFRESDKLDKKRKVCSKCGAASRSLGMGKEAMEV